MKKFKCLLCLLALFVLSCEKERDSLDSKSIEIESDFISITNSVVGYEEDGVVRLGVSDEKIMTNFKEFVKKNKLNLKPQTFSIVKIDNKNYLRFYNEDKRVSTMELIKGENNKVALGETVCTSDYCAHCCGCVPDGDYCTECPGDCSRTTSG